MPNGKGFLKHNFVGLTQGLIITWHEHSNPNAELGRKYYPAPHGEESLVMEGLNPVLHTCKFWTTSDGSTLETLLDIDFSFDAGIINQSMMQPLTFIVGSGEDGVPNDGEYDYVNEDLAGADYYVFQTGLGLLVWGVHIEKKVTGGFHRIDGSPFAGGDAHTLFVFQSVAQQIADPTTATGDYTLADLPAGISFDSTHLGKHFQAKSSATILPVIFGASVPNGKVKFSTYTGAQRYIKFSFATPVLFNGESKSTFWLGKNEMVEFRIVGGAVHIENYNGDYNRVGTLSTGRKQLPNTLHANGAAYSKNDLGRFWEDFVSQLPANQIVTSLSAWNTQDLVIVAGVALGKFPNKGKFCIVGDTVYLPDHRDISIKYDAGNTVNAGYGALEHEQMLSHNHQQKGGKDGGGTMSYVLDFNNDPLGQNVSLKTNNTGGDAQRVDSHSMMPLYVI